MRVKFSAFPLYRFFCTELSAMTKAGLACIALFGALAFVLFSPGFSFSSEKTDAAPASALEITGRYAETGVFEDSEPLFLPTRWNFGAAEEPAELRLPRAAFSPLSESLLPAPAAPDSAIKLKYDRTPPRADEALGADAWPIARGFGAGTLALPAAAKDAGTRVRVENAETGDVVFEGEAAEISGEDERMLLAPAEFLCGVASGFDAPRAMPVRSCGNADLDARIGREAEALLKKLRLRRGVYRVFVDLR